MYSNLKIFPLLIERETPNDACCCSLFSDESPKRERERESLFVGEENTLYDALSLSLSVFFFFFSSLCVSARSFSLSSLVRRGWKEK